MTLGVSIVDDDKPTRDLLAEVVVQCGHFRFVSAHGNTADALARLPNERPDVVLMDINIPELNGIECVRLLKPVLPATQFLMLTVYAETDHIFAALAAGATGYLLKTTRREQLIGAIQEIAEGGSPMSCAIARKVVQSFAKQDVPAPRQPTTEQLSPREHAVLDLLAQGYLKKEIASALSLSPMTVDTYVRRIYEKLHVHSRSQAIAVYLQG